LLTAGIAILSCIGCAPTSESRDTVTYHRDIAPLVHAHCAVCHRPGEAAPFSLLTYDDIHDRANQIVEVTRSRFMPPWLPAAGHGEFVGQRRLSDAEIELLARWVAADMPEGEPTDAPAAVNVTSGWQLGPPHVELETPPYPVAAGGGDSFRNFVVPVEIDGPRWVESIELRPANPRVTHHARLGIDRSGESTRRDAATAEPGYDGMAWGQDPAGQLVTWVPGMTAQRGMPGTAWRLLPGDQLVLHTHMQPTGKPETVRFRIGILFADEPPKRRPVMLRVGSREIDIPAGENAHVERDAYQLPIDVDVHGIFPHAHSLCREIHVAAQLPDGTEQPLLWIERFDENWHDQYRYAQPVRLAAGTEIVTRFTYDNTAANIRNRHNPPRRTVYGSNVDDEMADVYLQVTATHEDQRAVLLEHYEQYDLASKLAGYQKTLEVHSDDVWSRDGLAAGYFQLGQFDAAIRELDARLQQAPDSTFTVTSLGLAHLAAGDYQHAEEKFRAALADDDAYALAWFGLGRVLVATERTDEAAAALRRAVELAPGLAAAHIQLGDLHLAHRELESAAAAYTAANEVAPDDANALLKLAEVRAAEQRDNESLRLLEAAHALAPYVHPPKVLLAIYSLHSGEADRARRLLAESHAELPDHPVPSLFLGQFARRDGDSAAARRHLEAAVAAPLPANWPASHRTRFLVLLHGERFELAQQLEDEGLARAALGDWLRIEPENPRVRQLFERFEAGRDEE
jgi:tetratricopeptide (TPR) repeat protein